MTREAGAIRSSVATDTLQLTELTLSELSQSGSRGVPNRCTGTTSKCEGDRLAALPLYEDRTVTPYKVRRLCGKCLEIMQDLGLGPFLGAPEPSWLARARAGLGVAKDYTGRDAA